MITVPSERTEEVKQLLSIIGSPNEPIYVACKPDKRAQQNECFTLVDAKVNKEGGEQIIGWQIWQTSLLLEAEFHAVWKTPNGELVDITPKSIPFKEILFVADPETAYEGKQVNNIRINLSGNPLVDEFIAIHEAVFRIENKGERAFKYELSLSGEEANAHHKLNLVKPVLEIMALQGCTRNSHCFCGSEKKYKACHGKVIKEFINAF